MTDQKPNKNSTEIKERLVALTRDLILIPSIKSKPEELRRCYQFIKNHLESLDQIVVREFENNGIQSLVATAKGCEKPEILLCGHLDVIAHPNLSDYRSHIDQGRIYGPGAGDMKGALAVLIEIFRYMHSINPKASLGIAVTSDEETGGESGIGYLFSKEGVSCRNAMIPDGGSLNEITVKEKGILHLRILAHGSATHAARPWLGRNPIDLLMESLAKLKVYFMELEKEDSHWYPTCAVTIIGTENQTTNRIPSQASAVLDIRFPPPFTTQAMLTQIKENLGREIELEVIISAEPTDLFPDALYGQVIQEVTGKPVNFVLDDAGSDARYLASRAIPVMMSRPIVGNLHSEKEWIDIESMVLLFEIYKRFLTMKLSWGQGILSI